MKYTGSITDYFRALYNLGYEDDAIREQVWQFSQKYQTDDQKFIDALKADLEARQRKMVRA